MKASRRKPSTDSYVVVSVLFSEYKRKCALISFVIIFQCLTAFALYATVLLCIWHPDHATLDLDKLARIMYLFDPEACNYKLHEAIVSAGTFFSNDTKGLDLIPIRHIKPIASLSIRLSAKTRRYIKISIVIHAIWMVLSFVLYSVRWLSHKRVHIFNYIVLGFIVYSIFVIGFDLSMAIVYVADIQKSLTKEMLIRYSGWSLDITVRNPDEFAGWIPICAAIIWLRCFIFLFVNIYICKVLKRFTKHIKNKEITGRLTGETHSPIPNVKHKTSLETGVLYYAGDNYPVYRKERNSVI